MKLSWPIRSYGTAKAVIATILALGPLSATAHGSISNQLATGICKRASMGLELQMCDRSKTSLTGRSAGAVASSARVWTQTSPCYRNHTEGEEFCVFTSSTFADSHGITILTSSKGAARFATKDAFVHPETVQGVNRDIVSETEHGTSLPPLSYCVEAMPGKGYGVVATKFLNRGDLIMSTTASIVVDYEVYHTLDNDKFRKLQTAAIDSLPSLHRTRFMNLSTHDGAAGHEETIAKIVATNAFDIEAEDDDDDDPGFFVVFPEISRLNHDCRPNADYHFDMNTLTQHIRAVRPIAAGEEITVSYIDSTRPRKKRMERLKKTWGFDCSCSLCTQSDALSKASDTRIAKVHELRKDLVDYTFKSRATPEMAQLYISLFEQERLHAMMYEAYSYAAIEYNGVGEPWLATKYALLAVDFGLMSVGTDNDDVREMRELASDPFAHWSWMLRTSRRMRWGKKASK